MDIKLGFTKDKSFSFKKSKYSVIIRIPYVIIIIQIPIKFLHRYIDRLNADIQLDRNEKFDCINYIIGELYANNGNNYICNLFEDFITELNFCSGKPSDKMDVIFPELYFSLKKINKDKSLFNTNNNRCCDTIFGTTTKGAIWYGNEIKDRIDFLNHLKYSL